MTIVKGLILTYNHYVEKNLLLINSGSEPCVVPVQLEEYASVSNCYNNVLRKVQRDGGDICYGWSIWQTQIICEAEHHAVWEDATGNLVDITPRPLDIAQILFVPDPLKIFINVSFDNIRLNISGNPLVDIVIQLAELIFKIENMGNRISEYEISLPAIAVHCIQKYTVHKENLQQFIYRGGKPGTKCYCGSYKSYSTCHGIISRAAIGADLDQIFNALVAGS